MKKRTAWMMGALLSAVVAVQADAFQEGGRRAEIYIFYYFYLADKSITCQKYCTLIN